MIIHRLNRIIFLPIVFLIVVFCSCSESNKLNYKELVRLEKYTSGAIHKKYILDNNKIDTLCIEEYNDLGQLIRSRRKLSVIFESNYLNLGDTLKAIITINKFPKENLNLEITIADESTNFDNFDDKTENFIVHNLVTYYEYIPVTNDDLIFNLMIYSKSGYKIDTYSNIILVE